CSLCRAALCRPDPLVCADTAGCPARWRRHCADRRRVLARAPRFSCWSHPDLGRCRMCATHGAGWTINRSAEYWRSLLPPPLLEGLARLTELQHGWMVPTIPLERLAVFHGTRAHVVDFVFEMEFIEEIRKRLHQRHRSAPGRVAFRRERDDLCLQLRDRRSAATSRMLVLTGPSRSPCGVSVCGSASVSHCRCCRTGARCTHPVLRGAYRECLRPLRCLSHQSSTCPRWSVPPASRRQPSQSQIASCLTSL